MKTLVVAFTLAGLMAMQSMAAAPTFADDPVEHRNPRDPDNPFAVAFTAGASETDDGKPEICVALYKSPRAFGEELWNQPPTGGNPGWILQLRAGTPWTCSPRDPLE